MAYIYFSNYERTNKTCYLFLYSIYSKTEESAEDIYNKHKSHLPEEFQNLELIDATYSYYEKRLYIPHEPAGFVLPNKLDFYILFSKPVYYKEEIEEYKKVKIDDNTIIEYYKIYFKTTKHTLLIV